MDKIQLCSDVSCHIIPRTGSQPSDYYGENQNTCFGQLTSWHSSNCVLPACYESLDSIGTSIIILPQSVYPFLSFCNENDNIIRRGRKWCVVGIAGL